MSILGTRVVRTEDPRLLTAGGTYTDDLRLPELAGAARATFVRSPVAHARVTAIDKGIGEAGTIGATPAALSAVVDAVTHLGVRHIDMPATPLRVWTAISEARASA
jgi:CO/xanthine dehydrogenase Mo-binding subunit